MASWSISLPGGSLFSVAGGHLRVLHTSTLDVAVLAVEAVWHAVWLCKYKRFSVTNRKITNYYSSELLGASLTVAPLQQGPHALETCPQGQTMAVRKPGRANRVRENWALWGHWGIGLRNMHLQGAKNHSCCKPGSKRECTPPLSAKGRSFPGSHKGCSAPLTAKDVTGTSGGGS